MVDKIKEIINEKGLKQRYVAENAGMTEQQLSDILNGRKLLRAEHIMPLCNALGVKPEDVLGDPQRSD